jgi:hypothetical protein
MQNQFRCLSLAVAVSIGLGGAGAHANTVTLPLSGIHTGADIGTYFDGGSDSVPTDGTGPNLGIAFSSNATAQKAGDSQASGDGKFENNPSGQGEILYFSSSNTTAAYMNDAAGFTGLSFNYSYSNNSGAAGEAYLYSGLNGTGTLLETLSLSPAATSVGCAARTDAYCTWSSASTGTAAFGTAESVVFAAAGLTAAPSATGSPTIVTEFDGVAVTPVPLPAAAWFLVSGFSGLAGFARRRRAVTAT